jgi:hypothetical protein
MVDATGNDIELNVGSSYAELHQPTSEPHQDTRRRPLVPGGYGAPTPTRKQCHNCSVDELFTDGVCNCCGAKQPL